MFLKRQQITWSLAAGTLALLVATTPALAAWPAQYSDVDTWPAWASDRVGPGPDGGYTYQGGVLPEVTWWELMIGDRPDRPGDLRTFRPDNTISRAEFAAIISRGLGLGIKQSTGDDWYQPYVTELARLNILPAADGDWHATMARQEMGRIIGRAAAWYGLTPTQPPRQLNDLDGVAGADEIRLATRLGVITGYPDSSYRPDATATRTEAAAMAMRLVKLLKKHAPSAQELAQVAIKHYKDLAASDRDAAVNGNPDADLLTKTTTSALLYGPGGSLATDKTLRNARPEWGWNDLVGQFTVQAYTIRDTVAILRLSASWQPRHPDGSAYGEVIHGETFGYLTKVDGVWKLSNCKRLDEFDDQHRPVPESTALITVDTG